MDTLILNLGYGVASGLFVAGGGYFQKHGQQDFEIGKFAETILVGSVVGLLSYGLNVEPGTAQLMANGFVTALIENFGKGFKRMFVR